MSDAPELAPENAAIWGPKLKIPGTTMTLEELGAKVAESHDWEVAVKPPTLKEKLSKVAHHCAYIQKEGENTFHHYRYATASDVFARVNEALIANRLVSVPTFRIFQGGDLVTVECTLIIHDLDSTEIAKIVAFGSGMDKGDKAVMKAQTAALKYAWIMGLNISTGDDPEADLETDAKASGEPLRPRQTPEGYAAKVDRNKRAELSPLAVKLSDEINKSLADEKSDREYEKKERQGRHWPPSGEEIAAAMGPTEEEELCRCGGPLLLKMTKGKKDKAGKLTELPYAYKVCKARHQAWLDKDEEFPQKDHTWKRVP